MDCSAETLLVITQSAAAQNTPAAKACGVRVLVCSIAELSVVADVPPSNPSLWRSSIRSVFSHSAQFFWITTAIQVKSIIEVPLGTHCFVIVISLSGLRVMAASV
jgi:hypothetical protein